MTNGTINTAICNKSIKKTINNEHCKQNSKQDEHGNKDDYKHNKLQLTRQTEQ